eukprot:scaffold626_cov409-Prasinococcus_capsulatus_cf.AAC.7
MHSPWQSLDTSSCGDKISAPCARILAHARCNVHKHDRRLAYGIAGLQIRSVAHSVGEGAMNELKWQLWGRDNC